MAKQRTFASLAWSTKGKVTRRERFLAEMDQVIPWRLLLDPRHGPARELAVEAVAVPEVRLQRGEAIVGHGSEDTVSGDRPGTWE
jgi:hypothetical protein